MAAKKHTVVPEPLKQSITHEVEQLLQNKFKPGLSLQAEAAQKHGFNYVVDLYTTWRGRSFYLCAKYRNPRAQQASQEYFEVRTTRLEYIGGRRFSLAYINTVDSFMQR
jgi:hypothetical protein